jgi:voltage-gated potassium channel
VPSARNDRSTNWVVRRASAKPLTARRAAGIISVFTLTLTLVSAIVAFLLDRDDFPNLGISIWWALQTVTTVGYGDFVPHNTEGRVIGSLVMLGGISFAAVVTASIAAALIEAARRRGIGPGESEDPLGPKLDDIAARLERLEEAVKRSTPPGPSDTA